MPNFTLIGSGLWFYNPQTRVSSTQMMMIDGLPQRGCWPGSRDLLFKILSVEETNVFTLDFVSGLYSSLGYFSLYLV